MSTRPGEELIPWTVRKVPANKYNQVMARAGAHSLGSCERIRRVNDSGTEYQARRGAAAQYSGPRKVPGHDNTGTKY
jgi:hypothetical protein